MNVRMVFATILGLTVAALAPAPTLGQDNPKAQLQLSGSFRLQNATPSDDGTVNLDFSATLMNNGPDDVSGKVLLRDYSNNDTVWARFGDNTISAGGSVDVSANVTVPKGIYKSWTGGGSPPVFIYAENSRGTITAVNIPLVPGAAPPAKK
jgi:hypothetical protein